MILVSAYIHPYRGLYPKHQPLHTTIFYKCSEARYLLSQLSVVLDNSSFRLLKYQIKFIAPNIYVQPGSKVYGFNNR